MSNVEQVSDPYRYQAVGKTWKHDLVIPAINRFLTKGSGRLLDIGCGNGALLSELDTKGYEVSGIDFSPSGITIAQSRGIGSFRLADATTDLADLYGLHLFDAVISVEVIEHVFDPSAFLQNIYRMLKPGGRVLLTTPYNGWLKNVAVALSGKFDRHVDPLWIGGHIKFWSYATLSAALKDARFESIEFEGAGRVPYLWKSMVMSAIRNT